MASQQLQLAPQQPEMSATEAHPGLELKVELECALESEVEFGLKFELPS